MRRAQELARACDLFLAVGSSLVVYPAAAFPGPREAERRQARRSSTGSRHRTRRIADLVIRAEIGVGARVVHRAELDTLVHNNRLNESFVLSPNSRMVFSFVRIVRRDSSWGFHV